MNRSASFSGLAVDCRDLVKRYADVVAVAGLDLAVRRGECFGLLGPNGAGKTTTVEILEGLKPPTSGVVEILGEAWGGGGDRRLRARLGVQLQETHLPDKLTVFEVLRLFRSFYPSGLDPERAVAIVELEEKRNARVEKLSGGQKQRLSLACALIGEPEILFLDEPTTGLDPQARLKVWEVAEGFRARGGTLLLTTHYMEEAARLCDRIAIVDHGRKIAEGTPRELVASLGADQIVEVSFAGDRAPAETSLSGLPGVKGATLREGGAVLTVADVAAALPALVGTLEREAIGLATLATHQATLEDVFVNLTGRGLRDE